MNLNALAATAQKMVADNRGLLAIDESDGTIKKRFDTISVPSTEENRRDYRANLMRADGLGRYIGGVILFDETLRQAAADMIQAGAEDLTITDDRIHLSTQGVDRIAQMLSETIAASAR